MLLILQGELDLVIVESEQLEESRRQVEAAMGQTKRPLRTNTICQLAREARKGIDRVRDCVEVSVSWDLNIV